MDSYLLKAVFSEESAGALFSAFKDLQRLQCDRFALQIFQSGKVKISTQNESKTVTTIVDFKDDFLKEADIKADFKFGIINVNEMVSIFNTFSGGFVMFMDQEKMLLKTDETELNYFAGNLKIIRNGPAGLENPLPYIQNIDFDVTKYKAFIKALPILDYGYAIFKGSNGQSEFTISVMDKDIRSNSFTQKIPCEKNKETFKIVVDKQLLMTLFSSNNFLNLKMGICKDLLHFEGQNNAFKASYFMKTMI
jgi:hypothetical protein